MNNKSFLMRMIILIICAVISTSMVHQGSTFYVTAANDTELRGVWVSTVANIDYPSSPTIDATTLKDELIQILDNCKDMGFNAVFFQVRPSSDAFYKSEYFPWSRYLTGSQGTSPLDDFDPLEFAVEEAHKRGIQLHAWINPYRVTNSSGESDSLSSDNPAVSNPDLVIKDANGKIYYNPGDSTAVELIIKGAEEIVANYDVDGLHMDDYFYPDAAFNDDITYSFHKDEYNNQEDWRRSNVNYLVKTLDERLHSIKPEIQFGISPRGIWANKSEMPEGSDTAGKGSYNSIYADSRAWVKNGWVDYIMPQIYWNIGYEVADYTTLCKWWGDVTSGTDVKLYIGEGAYRTTSSTLPAWTGESGTNELRTHITNGRADTNIGGYCCFTYNDFIENPSIYALMKELNSSAAQPPEGVVSVSGAGVENSEIPKQEDTTTPPISDEISGGTTLPTLDGKYVNKFIDMDNYWWAMDSINDLAARGIIKGRSETTFDPDSNITRADNIVLLLRVLGKSTEAVDNFDDVYAGSYYYREVGIAKALGIASGVGNNKFDPEAPVRRQDMATMAYRVLSREGVLTSIPNTGVLNQFKDKEKIDFYAREAMAACVDAGLMSGYGDSTINPQGNASRLEVALFIHRISEMVVAR